MRSFFLTPGDCITKLVQTVVVVHQVMAWARALPVPLCTTVATEANDCPRAT